jgi:hypothetical protein
MDSRTDGRKAGGRPPKFNEERRPITVTLPERTIRLLAALDPDRARAIVKATDIVAGSQDGQKKPVEVVEVMPGKAVILVGPNRALRRIGWLRLLEVAPARYLLTIPSGTPVDSLEVAIMDVLENLPEEEREDRHLLEELRTQIGSRRRSKTMSKEELLLIQID